MYCYYVFSDLSGFSKLSEPEIGIFQKQILPDIAEKLTPLRDKAKVFNTWGDAVFAVFENCIDAVNWMLEYRDFFTNGGLGKYQIKSVLPRIAAHAGEAEILYDPLQKSDNALGTKVNMAARIEPVTRPGDIFVTKQFKENATDNLINSTVEFDEMGYVTLAKSFGEAELFRMRKKDEEKHIIERISKSDLKDVLPYPDPLNNDEQNTLDFLRQAPNVDVFLSSISSIKFSEKSPAFNFEAAKLFYSFGDYSKAIELIEEVEKFFIDVDGVSIYPFRFNVDIRKLKANCLSRMNNYEESANIIYGLWSFGLRDSDTLSMLAAQYKRKALDYKDGKINIDNINSSLLIRAKELYLEAFRLNISDFYPAINAAYLYKIIGGTETGKGTKLASYIINVWTPISKTKSDWWLHSTLAEAELLQDDYEAFLTKLKEAIEKCKPNIFNKTSTREQLIIYEQKMRIEQITLHTNKAIELLN